MRLRFIKMQGAGNDYVYLDCLRDDDTARYIQQLGDADLHALAVRLSDRHFGIGGDGMVLILPSLVADVQMRIFNADGSEAEMCGNASRCIGRYVFGEQLVAGDAFLLETRGGLRRVMNGDAITVDMGTTLGNPHLVRWVDTLSDDLVLGEGPRLEHSPEFPERTNVEFAVVDDLHHVRMRVWERGSGETLACGTGACATAMEAVRSGRCAYPVEVQMTGGTLTIDVHADGHIHMSGPAEIVFVGEWGAAGF